jgi:hypothetical protein
VGDDAHRQAQEVVDGAHPLGVAAGQVVVDGDDVDAAAGQPVEGGGERRDEGLALAGLHLGDLALVQDDAAHHLDVEMAHPSVRCIASRVAAKTSGRALSMASWSAVVLALAAFLGDLAATLQLGVVALVVGRLLGLAGFADLLANLVDKGAYLCVGARLHLGLQLVDPLDERLDAMELAVVRVDEAAQEAKH